jgi:hypothetical protein
MTNVAILTRAHRVIANAKNFFHLILHVDDVARLPDLVLAELTVKS